jgi:hypothetical protein
MVPYPYQHTAVVCLYPFEQEMYMKEVHHTHRRQ